MIAAAVGLAYLVAAVLGNLWRVLAVARRAWLFVLFNPLLLYVGAAWGQIDAIVALLALAALVLLYAGAADGSAAAPGPRRVRQTDRRPVVLVVALAYLSAVRLAARPLATPRCSWPARWCSTCCRSCCSAGGGAPCGTQRAVHDTGAMSFMTVVRLLRDPLLLPGTLVAAGPRLGPRAGRAASRCGTASTASTTL